MSIRSLLYPCFALFCLAPTTLWSLCGEPQPRLVCAEATNSKAVVVARLVRRRFAPSKTDSDLNIYSLESMRLLRGEIAHDFVIHERNDSGRSGVDWKIGQQYLLFISYSRSENAYIVEGCSNSDLLTKSSTILNKVLALGESQAKPLISGLVTTDAWSNGISGADIVASGPTGTFKTRSGSDGRFELRVDPGTYNVTARTPEFTFAAGILSYEDPRHIVLEIGACAQVQFEGNPRKR